MATKYHKITGNESVGTIAGMYGVDPQTLLQANPGVSNLASGAFLRVPSVAGAVKAGGGTGFGGNLGAGGNSANQATLNRNNINNNPLFGSQLPANLTNLQQPGISGINSPTNYREAGFSNPAPEMRLTEAGVNQLTAQNQANTFTLSPATNRWAENISQGNPTAVNNSIFNEMVLTFSNSGVPRDVAMQAADSRLRNLGYTYNPINKNYTYGQPTNAVPNGAVVDKNGAVVKDITGNAVNTEGGKFSADAFQNYKQKTIAAGGQRWWIRGLEDKWKPKTTTTDASTGDGTNVAGAIGSNASIWRIG